MIEQRHPRSIIQAALSALVALSMAAAFVLVGGVGIGSAQGGSGGDHGSGVSSVAQSSCTATNPHNPNVANHGMCVSAAAHSMASTVTGSSATGMSTSSTTTTSTTTSSTSTTRTHPGFACGNKHKNHTGPRGKHKGTTNPCKAKKKHPASGHHHP